MVTTAANENTPQAGGSQQASPPRVRLFDKDVDIKSKTVPFNGKNYVIPVATTAYGDTLYGVVASIVLGRECNDTSAQQYHAVCVERFSELDHKGVIIRNQLQDLKQMSYKIHKTVFATYEGLKMIFEHSESAPVKKNLDKIMALLKQAQQEAVATTQATTPGASGKKRVHSGQASGATAGSVADMYAAHDNAQGAPVHKIPRGAMQALQHVSGHSAAVAACAQNLKACNQEIVAFAGNAQQLQVVVGCTQNLQACNQELVAFAGNAQAVVGCTQNLQACNQEIVAFAGNAQAVVGCTQNLQACNQELVAFAGNAQAVVGCTQNIQACSQALAALAEQSQEVHNSVQRTLAQKDAIAGLRTEYELLGAAIDTTAGAFVRMANGKGLLVDQEVRHASVEAARNEKLLDFEVRMEAIEDRKLERAKAYADLEARKAPAPAAAAAPAPMPDASPAPMSDAASVDEEDEGPFTVRDVMQKYKLLDGIRKNHHSSLVFEAGGRAYNAHSDAGRVFVPKKQCGDYCVRAYAVEDVPHVLAACHAAIQAYREAHPVDATQRTMDEFVAVTPS